MTDPVVVTVDPTDEGKPAEKPTETGKLPAEVQALFDAEWNKKHSTLLAENKEAKKAKQQLADLLEAQKTDEQKALDAQAARDKQLSELIRENQVLKAQGAITSAAAAAGIANPALAVRLIDVEYNEDGTIATDIQAAITELVDANPYLKGAPVVEEVKPKVIPGQSVIPDETKTLTLEDIAAMDHMQIANDPALRARIAAARANIK